MKLSILWYNCVEAKMIFVSSTIFSVLSIPSCTTATKRHYTIYDYKYVKPESTNSNAAPNGNDSLERLRF